MSNKNFWEDNTNVESQESWIATSDTNASQDATQAPNKFSTFTCFPKLPPELRLQIWDDTEEPRIIESYFTMDQANYRDRNYSIRKHTFRDHTENPILVACRESHEETMFRSSYIKVQDDHGNEAYFKPEDTVYFSGSSQCQDPGLSWDFTGAFLHCEVRHLAIDMIIVFGTLETYSTFARRIRKDFSFLQTLTFVHDYRLVANRYMYDMMYPDDDIYRTDVMEDHKEIRNGFKDYAIEVNFRSFRGKRDASGAMIFEDCIISELQAPNIMMLSNEGLIKADGIW